MSNELGVTKSRGAGFPLPVAAQPLLRSLAKVGSISLALLYILSLYVAHAACPIVCEPVLQQKEKIVIHT